jgi:hypothetical protein
MGYRGLYRPYRDDKIRILLILIKLPKIRLVDYALFGVGTS